MLVVVVTTWLDDIRYCEEKGKLCKRSLPKKMVFTVFTLTVAASFWLDESYSENFIQWNVLEEACHLVVSTADHTLVHDGLYVIADLDTGGGESKKMNKKNKKNWQFEQLFP